MPRRAGWLLLGLLVGGWAMPAPASDIVIDDQNTYARFQLRLPLGREVDGRFPSMQAEWLPQADGRWRVHVRLPTDTAEIPGSPRYTRIMRSEMFFDSQRHPQIQFLSDPFEAGMLARGGEFGGMMTIRGVSRRLSWQVASTTCLPPTPRHCRIEASGEVSRRSYGMRALPGVVGDAVRFRLRITHGDAP